MTESTTDTVQPDFERCRVLEKLRSGPVTDVYRAEQRPLGRPVLIKALSASVLPTSPFAATLEREAQLLAELNHENIVRLYDFVRRDDTMWLVLEDVEGFTLADVIQDGRTIHPLGAAALGLQIARALEHAHQHDIVHRDVQPQNVLVSKQGTVKLVNFAVASDHRLPTAPELLEGDSGFGTPAYMSPEQVLGESADPRSDLFSLGVILYEMLTGRRPFDAPDSRAATQRIRHDPPAPLGRIANLPSALERIVQRCLQKMPSDRFFATSELTQALEGVLAQTEGETAEHLVALELSRLGLIATKAKRESRRRWPVVIHPRAPTVGYAMRGYVVCLVLLVGGAGAIQYADAKSRDSTPRGGSTRLELLPAKTAYLRVVADPWAHVIVDGQRFDTTPFARPIPLSAGVHYVRFEHPNAPEERRTVRLAAGETVLIDVKMDIRRPKAQAEPSKLPPQVESTGTP